MPPAAEAVCTDPSNNHQFPSLIQVIQLRPVGMVESSEETSVMASVVPVFSTALQSWSQPINFQFISVSQIPSDSQEI